MQLTCPNCRTAIPAEKINIAAALANCPACNEVFSFDAQGPARRANDGWGRAMTPPAPEARDEVSMPRGFHLSQQLGDLVITRDWRSWTVIPLLLFCCFWDGFLVFWYAMGITQGGPLIMFLFPLLHVAAGVFLTYTAMAQLFNHTDIRINTQFLTVQHYPLPWMGNRSIPVAMIQQLFCAEKYSNTRNGTSVTFTVFVILQGGERIELLSGLDQAAHARFIEQQVEATLGIQNRPVAGEMPPVM
jgi:predicted Zn finger-like uncharacterized protein